MQTFLPFPNFQESAQVLDYRRLGKQRVENLQIMTALLEGRGWVNHPATKMWTGHTEALMFYQAAICHEWTSNRGFKDSCLEKTFNLYEQYRVLEPLVIPSWLGDPDFHKSHRSNLLRKDPEFYRPKFEEDLDPDLPYIWPSP